MAGVGRCYPRYSTAKPLANRDLAASKLAASELVEPLSQAFMASSVAVCGVRSNTKGGKSNVTSSVNRPSGSITAKADERMARCANAQEPLTKSTATVNKLVGIRRIELMIVH